MGFPGSSAGKEATCNAGNLGSIPGSGRSPGRGCGHPLQYSCLENPHGQRSLKSESESHSVLPDSLWPQGLNSPGGFSSQNTRVGSLSLPQEIPTQGWNPGLPHCRRILYQLNHQGSPRRRSLVGYSPWGLSGFQLLVTAEWLSTQCIDIDVFQTEKIKVPLFFSWGNHFIYKTPQNLQKLLELIRDFTTVSGYKVNVEQSIMFAYTSNELLEIKKQNNTIHRSIQSTLNTQRYIG